MNFDTNTSSVDGRSREHVKNFLWFDDICTWDKILLGTCDYTEREESRKIGRISFLYRYYHKEIVICRVWLGNFSKKIGKCCDISFLSTSYNLDSVLYDYMTGTRCRYLGPNHSTVGLGTFPRQFLYTYLHSLTLHFLPSYGTETSAWQLSYLPYGQVHKCVGTVIRLCGALARSVTYSSVTTVHAWCFIW